MAGAVGHVPNRSGFASFRVKEWQPWMTEVVVLHASGMSIPELMHRFDRSKTHLSNLLNTSQAKEIVEKLQRSALSSTVENIPARMSALRQKALQNMENIIEDKEGILQKTSPFAFLEANRKVFETLAKNDAPQTPAAQTTNVQQNIQQNIIGSVSTEVLERLRAGPSLPVIDVPSNVEYLGSPPTREGTRELQSGGVDSTPRQGKNGLALVMPNDPPTFER